MNLGVWEVFTTLAQEGQIYKYHITRDKWSSVDED